VTGARARESYRMPPTDATAHCPPAERAERVYRVLQSLRTSFIRIGVVVVVFSIGGYFLAESIMRLLQRQTGVRLAAVVLFGAGVLFCLNISLPYGVQFLLEFEGPNIEAIISVQKFVSFCLLFLFGFGFIFELPLAMILAGRIGIVTYQRLAGNRRYAILVITIVSAVLTPTPDAFNLAMMAAPLYLLFELGLFGMRFNSAAKRDAV
jgi:Sec-independent protein secretion pathway component TatC